MYFPVKLYQTDSRTDRVLLAAAYEEKMSCQMPRALRMNFDDNIAALWNCYALQFHAKKLGFLLTHIGALLLAQAAQTKNLISLTVLL